MSCRSFLKFSIYASICLILTVAIVIEIVFISLGNGNFGRASGNRAWLIAVGTVFFILLLIVVIIGFCGICRQSTLYLLIYTAITALIFIGLWISFGYLKKGKGRLYTYIS